MNKKPKQFIVYWTSETARRVGYNTDRYKANMKIFDDLEKAQNHAIKLEKMKASGFTYQQRYVHHVSYVYKI